MHPVNEFSILPSTPKLSWDSSNDSIQIEAYSRQIVSLSYLIGDNTVAIPPECDTLEIASDPKGRDDEQ